MYYIFISTILHLLLVIMISVSQIGINNNQSSKQSGGCAGSNNSLKSEKIVSITLKSDVQKSVNPSKNETTKKTSDSNVVLIKSKKAEKTPTKKENKVNNKTFSKETKLNIKNKQKDDNNLNKNKKGGGSGIGSSGIGNGVGKGTNTTGKGSGDGETIEKKEAILKAQINAIIKQNWNPPDEYIARSDIIITVKISFNSLGEILGYSFTQFDQTKIEYRNVAQSIARAIENSKDDMDLKNLIIQGKINYITLIFCPRDGI